MHADDVIRLVPVGLTWLAFAYTIGVRRSRPRSPAAVAVSQALLLFAFGTTFLIPQFYSAVDSRIGIANVSRVISHVFIVVACWRALVVLYYIADDRPQRRIRPTGYLA